MRYVIVSVVKGEAGDFNNDIRKEVWQKFKVKSSKLPAHFTIKAPFEYDREIIEVERAIEEFCKNEITKDYIIEGYNHFDHRVIYMDVKMSDEGKEMHDRLIDKLSNISYLDFDKNDGKDKVFHITISSKKIRDKYDKLWDYVNQYPCSFKCKFDNVTIYKWEDNTWKVHKEFEICK